MLTSDTRIEILGISRTLMADESNDIAVCRASGGMRSQFQSMLVREITTSGRIQPKGILGGTVEERLSSLDVVADDDACEIERVDTAPGEKKAGAS